MRLGTAGRSVQVGAPAQRLGALMPRHACMHSASEWLGAALRAGAAPVRRRAACVPCVGVIDAVLSQRASRDRGCTASHAGEADIAQRCGAAWCARGMGLHLPECAGWVQHKTVTCCGRVADCGCFLCLPSKRGLGESRCRHDRLRQGASRTTRSNVHATLGRRGGWCRCRLEGVVGRQTDEGQKVNHFDTLREGERGHRHSRAGESVRGRGAILGALNQ